MIVEKTIFFLYTFCFFIKQTLIPSTDMDKLTLRFFTDFALNSY
jgi:hypothetical protein